MIKISEIWYVDASQQKKRLQKTVFRFRHFLAFLFAKKQPNLIKKNEENRQIHDITIEVVLLYLINLDYILKIQNDKKS